MTIFKVLFASVPLFGLALTLACSSGSGGEQGAPSTPGETGPVSVAAKTGSAGIDNAPGHSHAGHSHDEGEIDARIQTDLPPLLLNVDFGPGGVSPATLSIPLGREIQLVLRNRDVVEHHYHVTGLVPHYLLWLAKPGPVAAADGQSEEHAHHGSGQLVEYHICTGSVCPTGDAVHAHAMPGEIDIVSFVALDKGRFEVRDPINPEIRATVVVF